MSGSTVGILVLAALLLPMLSAFAGRLVRHRLGARAATSLTLLGLAGSLGLGALLLVYEGDARPTGGWAGLLPREGPPIDALAFDVGGNQPAPAAGEAAVAVVPLVAPRSDVAGAAPPPTETASPTPEPVPPTPEAPTPTPTPEPPTPEAPTPTPTMDLPPTATAPPSATPVVPAVYVVQAGDTLRSIAASLRVSVEALLAANGLAPDAGDRLRIGQELRVPSEVAAGGAVPIPTLAPTATPVPTATPTEAPPPTLEPTRQPPPAPVPPSPTRAPQAAPRTQPRSTEVRAYFVQPGDTLRSIAEQFGLTIDTLLRFNGLTPAEGDQLRPGQRLYIPATARAPATIEAYFVQPGDTLRSIAEQFGYSVDTLLRFNGLTRAEGDQIRPGQKLFIPAGE